jgi:hypothetical protein
VAAITAASPASSADPDFVACEPNKVFSHPAEAAPLETDEQPDAD